MLRALPPHVRLRSTVFVGSFDRFTIPPLLIPISHAFGISLGAAAAVASVYFVTYGAGQAVWGTLSDRFGRVVVLRVGVAAGALACIASALAPGLATLVVVRALAGFFFGAPMPTSLTYLGDTVPPRRRQQALVFLMAFASAGVALGTIVGGICAQFFDWRTAFAVSAVLAVGSSLMLIGLPEPPRERPDAGALRQVGKILRDRWAPIVIGLGFLDGVVVFGALTFVAAALQHNGVGAALAGSAAAGFGIANSLCAPLVTRALRTHATPVLIAGGASLAAAGLALCAIKATVPTTVVATAALGAGFGFMHTSFQMWATEVVPEARAVTISFFAAAVFLGGAAASAAAAPLLDDARFSAVFLIAAGGAVAVAIGGSLLRARYLATVERPLPLNQSFTTR
ncbi:unannotated protein [freshwater metagenome]|uniref:Unannotated protein n=1 Tax=freshwater metagenome TaxID=449393 RepID=A0A6J7HW10_9ZZZZ|nr:MFS transporter [Actinomycetota bacterium]